MSSGLIYAVIVVLWAAVLVPMWLRRHDEVTESRSVDRFQGAMRTLSRRGAAAASSRRDILVPPRATTRAVPDGAAEQLSAAAQAASRRRRTATALLAVTVLLVAVGGFGVLPLWTAGLPFLVMVAFMTQVSVRARRARARELAARRARAAHLRRQRLEAVEGITAPDGSLRVPPRRAAAATAAEDKDDQHAADYWFDQERPGRAAHPEQPPAVVSARAQGASAPALYDAVAERVWDPVPVPLPTYVLAPKAPRSVRVIDLTRPGHWTSGHLNADEQAEYEEASAATAKVTTDGIVTGEVLVQRYAVGD